MNLFIIILGLIVFIISIKYVYYIRANFTNDDELYDRVGFIKAILNDLPYSLIIATPWFGFAIINIGLSTNYNLCSILFFTLLSVFLFYSKKKGYIALSLTKKWNLGLLPNDIASLHIHSRPDNDDELLAILNALHNQGINTISFKSYLLHSRYIEHQNQIARLAIVINQADQWVIQYSAEQDSETIIPIPTYFVIICYQIFRFYRRERNISLVTWLNGIPRIARECIVNRN